jgi:hypothetical protein
MVNLLNPFADDSPADLAVTMVVAAISPTPIPKVPGLSAHPPPQTEVPRLIHRLPLHKELSFPNQGSIL